MIAAKTLVTSSPPPPRRRCRHNGALSRLILPSLLRSRSLPMVPIAAAVSIGYVFGFGGTKLRNFFCEISNP